MKFILLIILACWATAAEQPKLTVLSDKAVAQFEADQSKAKVEYDKKVSDLKKVLVTQLDKEILVAAQAGDLDLAVALKAKKEEFVPLAPAIVKKSKLTATLLGQQLVDGMWYFKGLTGHRYIKFLANGTIADGVNEFENTFRITDDMTLVFYQSNKSIQSKFSYDEKTNAWKQIWPVGVSWGPQSVVTNP